MTASNITNDTFNSVEIISDFMALFCRRLGCPKFSKMNQKKRKSFVMRTVNEFFENRGTFFVAKDLNPTSGIDSITFWSIMFPPPVMNEYGDWSNVEEDGVFSCFYGLGSELSENFVFDPNSIGAGEIKIVCLEEKSGRKFNLPSPPLAPIETDSQKFINPIVLEGWMVDWVKSGGNWENIPENKLKSMPVGFEDEDEINEYVSLAIERAIGLKK